MPQIPFDLDSMLDGGGEEADWVALLSNPEAESLWNESRKRRNQVDDVASAIQDRPWLAERMLALGRALRRSQSAAAGIGLTLRQPEFAAVLRAASTRGGLSIPWGQRAIHRSRLEDVLNVASEGGSIWYATAAGDGVLPGPGWKVESGDLPLLLVVVVDAPADTLVAALGEAKKVAACLIIAEGENRPT